MLRAELDYGGVSGIDYLILSTLWNKKATDWSVR